VYICFFHLIKEFHCVMKITKDENHMCIGGVDIINDLKAICERIVAG